MDHTRSRQRVWRAVGWLTLVAGSAGAARATAYRAERASIRSPMARRLTVAILGTGGAAPDATAPVPTIDARLQQEIDSAKLPFIVAAAGRYGESSADALRRVDSLITRSMDVFVLETGSTDVDKGVSADSTRANIRSILHRVRAAHPESWVCLVRESPPAALPTGDTAAFRALYGSLGRSERAIVLPAALDSLWPQLEPVLRKVASLRLGGP
jgi:hypothetical protein